LGAEFIHLPIPDCIYRRVRGPLGWCYPSHADIFGPVHPDDGERVGELAELLSALPAGRRLFAPLAIGGHVDHVLVRRAVETGFRPALTYYADQPYCARDPGPLAELRARADWIEESDVLDDESLAIKLDAVRAYASQAPKLYPGGFDEGSPARASLEVESFWRKG